MTKPLVIYHANCWDGFCAAWVARQSLGEIEALPAHYGTQPPAVDGRRVFMLDFSYPRAVLEDMHSRAESLVVLDHHATAQDALAGLPYCMFDMNKSGARLTWEYFFGDSPAPWLIDYTEDRDLWRHALLYSREINAALRSYPLDFTSWDQIDTVAADSLVPEGMAIRRAERQIIESHTRNASRIAILGHDVPCVNATTLFSEIAGDLAEGEPFAVCYFDRKDGKRQWSLRSRDGGVDVSEIAKMFGGGGHRNAAGFETDVPAGTLGATLRAPEGLLSEDDEGELKFAIGQQGGNVVVDFGKPVTWLGLPPDNAREFAGLLTARASAIEATR